MVKCMNDAHGNGYAMYNGDCVEVLRQLPDNCIDFSVYSPPFGDLFTYSASIADMGNSSCDGEFMDHYRFCAEELLRVVKPGRLVAVHCSDLPTRKWKDGYIGQRAFSDELNAMHIAVGFHFIRRITVWKDPVVEMQRTKSLSLLHKQIKKDSTKSAPGSPDYVLLFRVPGENAEPVGHRPEDFPVEQWQQWASPVWMDIDQTDVLNGYRNARGSCDERHICPLQLGLIQRLLVLYSNPGDTVLSPFAGIGSEGWAALRDGRRFVGVELKEEYFGQAVGNLDSVDRQGTLMAAGWR